MKTEHIGILIPTRNDRHKMLQFAYKQIARQSIKPVNPLIIETVDDTPINPNVKDITWRYKLGFERLIKKGATVVFLWEDDDWYSPNYLELMFVTWNKAGRPATFGLGDTFYYHLGVKSWHHQIHPERSSAFTTMINPSIMDKMKWPKDDYSFTDLEIWKQFPGKTITFPQPIAIGIKGYGEGAHFGGMGHNAEWATYAKRRDLNMIWLQQRIDTEAFEFYKTLIK